MYRVELKGIPLVQGFGLFVSMFLMYRVELKATRAVETLPQVAVPNVPCGVERPQERAYARWEGGS